MAQKSNPISLRLKKTNKLWNSCWYGDCNYTTQLLQDQRVSAYIQNICQQAKMAPPIVFLNRQRQQTSAFFFFSRQQRTNRLKRPIPRRGAQSLFQKSALKGADWLQKLLFWSCKVPIHAPNVINDNTPTLGSGNRPQLPLVRYSGHNYSGGSPLEKGLHLSPDSALSHISQTLPTLRSLFPYLLVSQAATPPYAAREEDAPPAFHLSSPHFGRPRPHSGETTRQVESPRRRGPTCFRYTPLLSTLKKNGDQKSKQTPPFHLENITGLAHAPLKKSKIQHSVPSHLTGHPKDWGFFAMRDQYRTASQVTAGAPYANRMPRPGKKASLSFHPGRKVATPWRNHLESALSAQTHHNSTLYFLLCPSVHQNPHFLATHLCFSLENRKIFRRLKDRLMQDISADSSIKGVRITCSGRVAARSKKAQKAKTESIQWGQTSLNVFSDLVNFASKSALTPFGKIGVKVWICYKEIKK